MSYGKHRQVQVRPVTESLSLLLSKYYESLGVKHFSATDKHG